MEKTISATEARVRFGEMMRYVVEEQAPIIVERSGQPQVVLLSVSEYERLKAAAIPGPPWHAQLAQLHARISVELGQRSLPPAADIIRQMREERDAQLLDLR